MENVFIRKSCKIALKANSCCIWMHVCCVMRVCLCLIRIICLRNTSITFLWIAKHSCKNLNYIKLFKRFRTSKNFFLSPVCQSRCLDYRISSLRHETLDIEKLMVHSKFSRLIRAICLNVIKNNCSKCILYVIVMRWSLM